MTRLAKFWIVTIPRKGSTIEDIVFESTAASFITQVRGGLAPEDEPAIFIDRAEAVAEGERRIAAYDVYRATLDGKETGR